MKAAAHYDTAMAKFIAMRRARHISCILRPCALLTPKCAAHVAARRDWGAIVEKEGQSHEVPWDGVGVFDCTLPSFTIVLSAVPRLDHSRNKITAREFQRGSPLVGLRNLRACVSHHRAVAFVVRAKYAGRRQRHGVRLSVQRRKSHRRREAKKSLMGWISPDFARAKFARLKYRRARRCLRSGTDRSLPPCRPEALPLRRSLH